MRFWVTLLRDKQTEVKSYKNTKYKKTSTDASLSSHMMWWICNTEVVEQNNSIELTSECDYHPWCRSIWMQTADHNHPAASETLTLALQTLWQHSNSLCWLDSNSTYFKWTQHMVSTAETAFPFVCDAHELYPIGWFFRKIYQLVGQGPGFVVKKIAKIFAMVSKIFFKETWLCPVICAPCYYFLLTHSISGWKF